MDSLSILLTAIGAVVLIGIIFLIIKAKRNKGNGDPDNDIYPIF